MAQTAKLTNDAASEVVLDGGGRVTLAGEPTASCTSTPAIRAFDQYQDRSVHVVHRTLGGAVEHGNRCSNGGANPARPGTLGGGSGGAVKLDGNTFTLAVRGSALRDNRANEGGGGIFFVSNDRSGTLSIDASSLSGNGSAGCETQGYPGPSTSMPGRRW